MEPEGETGAISGSFFFSFPPLRTFSRRHLSGAKLNRQVHLKASRARLVGARAFSSTCDNDTVSQMCPNARAYVASKEKMLVHSSGEHCYVDALWFKVMRTPVSPEQD
jgi:hypothetical protein